MKKQIRDYSNALVVLSENAIKDVSRETNTEDGSFKIYGRIAPRYTQDNEGNINLISFDLVSLVTNKEG